MLYYWFITIITSKTDNLRNIQWFLFVSPCKYAIGYVNSSQNFHTKTGATLIITRFIELEINQFIVAWSNFFPEYSFRKLYNVRNRFHYYCTSFSKKWLISIVSPRKKLTGKKFQFRKNNWTEFSRITDIIFCYNKYY